MGRGLTINTNDKQKEMMNKKRLNGKRFILMLCLIGCQGMMAQTFHTGFLKKAYTQLDIASYANEVKTGTSILHMNNRPIVVRTNDKGEVEHIGIQLFSTEMQELMPSPIYDCLEQMLLDHVYHINDNTLPREHLTFEKGSWNDMLKVVPTDECQIENQNDKYYVVRWLRDGTAWLSLRCPVNYELLAGSTRREMEQIFVRDLKAHQPATDVTRQIDPSIPLAEVNLSLSLYGNHKEYMTMNLTQLVSYCQSVGCKTQLVTDKPEGEPNSALLYLRNQASGYSHLLHLKGKRITDPTDTTPMSGRLFLFIPINNVEELFATPPAKSNPKRF